MMNGRTQRAKPGPAGGVNAELVELTEQLGLPRMDPGSVRSVRRRLGDDGAREHIRALATIVSELRAAGLPASTRSAANRIRQAGSADVAIERIRAAAARAERRRSGLCTLGRLSVNLDATRWNALADCGCRRCSNTLAVGLRRYTRVLISHAAPLLSRDEAEAECALALSEALTSWRGSGTFTKFYARIAECVLGEKIRDTIAWERLDRLDAPAFRSNALAVTALERIVDRTADVVEIVFAREGVRERLREARERREAALAGYQIATQ